MSPAIEWPEDDDAFVEMASRKIWLSAFASNNPRSNYHREADAASDEAESRGKPWLYQRAWNKALRSAGYEPTETQVARAQDNWNRECAAEAREDD